VQKIKTLTVQRKELPYQRTNFEAWDLCDETCFTWHHIIGVNEK
jgi:hypothetical protein